jgi:membrane peptidoglycan carboxypeptidase
MNSVHGISVTGGSYPARIWRDFMAPIHAGRKVQGFPDVELTGKTVKGKGVSFKEPKEKKKKEKPTIVIVVPPPPPPPPPECSDGVDNDGDGFTDMGPPPDPQCSDGSDPSESG